MIVRARRRPSLVLRTAGIAAIALAGLTCRDRNPLGPGLPQHASLAVDARFTVAPAGGPTIVLTNVRALLYPAAGGDTIVQDVSFGTDSAVLSFDNIVIQGTSELFWLRIAASDANGDTLFRALDSLRLTGGANPQITAPPMQYSGADTAVKYLTLTPQNDTIATGQTVQLSAVGVDTSSGAPVQMPVLVGWTSADPTRATVTAQGVVTANAIQGPVWIVARTYTNVADSISVYVQAPVAQVVVSPDTITVPRGTAGNFSAVTKDIAGNVLGRPVTWSSLDPSIATVDTAGAVTTLSVGTARVVATSGAKADTGIVQVLPIPVKTVAATPDTLVLLAGDSAVVTAQGFDSLARIDNDFPITWASADTSIAKVSTSGNGNSATISGSRLGQAIVRATVGTAKDSIVVIISANAVDTVTITPAAPSVPRGDSIALSARLADKFGNTITSIPATWSSLNGSVASVSSTGMVTGVSVGSAQIVAAAQSRADTVTVTVTAIAVKTVVATPDTMRLALGDSAVATAVAYDSLGRPDPDFAITWTSANPGKATVSTTGLINTLATGTAIIRAAVGSAKDSVVVIIGNVPVASILVTPDSARFFKDSTQQFTATAYDSVGNVLSGRTFTWRMADSTIATVDANGLVTGLKKGITYVRARINTVVDSAKVTVDTAVSLIDSVAVTPKIDTLTSFGDTIALSAQAFAAGVPKTGSFTWVSRDSAAVRVDPAGRAIAVTNGSAFIVATEVSSGRMDSAQVTVQQRAATISLTPNSVQRYLGTQQTFTASAVDGRGNPVGSATFRWSSKSPAIVSIDSVTGVATMTGIGQDTVFAVSSGVTGRAAVTVISAITKIIVTPDTVTLTALGLTQSYKAAAYDTLNAPMAGIVFTFNTTNPSVAPLSGTTDSATTATAVANGVTFIQASAQGVTGQGKLIVQQVLSSIEVLPTTATIAPNGVVVLTARGKDSNNQYIPGGSFTWNTDNAGVATVGATNGVVTGVSIGGANITATSGAITSNNSFVTVSNSVPPVITFGRDTLAIGRSTSQSIPIYLSTPDSIAHTVILAVRDTFAYFSSAKATIPAGQTTVNVTLNGRNAGSTFAYATDSAGQYAGDTTVVTVQSNVRFTTTSYSTNATEQITGQQVLLSDPAPAGGVYVTFQYQNAGVVTVSPDPAFVPAGQLAADVVITGDSAGTTQVTPVATGVNGTFSTFTVYAPTLAVSTPNLTVGAGQYNSAGYIYVPTYSKGALAFSTVSTDSSIATVPNPVTIPTGSYYQYYNASGYKVGVDTVTFSRPGWTSATQRITVTTPVLDVCCNTTLNSTNGNYGLSVYTRDSLGSANYRLQPLFVSVTSSDTSVVKVVDTLVTVQAGAYYANPRILPVSGGTAWIKVTAGGHVPDSVQVTVTAPLLSWSFYNAVLGVNQSRPNFAYVQIPNSVANPVIIKITQSDTSVLTLQDTVVIPTGSYYQYLNVAAKKFGTDTLIITATGYAPDTAFMVVSSTKLDVSFSGSYPTFSNDQAFTTYYRDSLGTANYAVNPVTVTYTSTDTNVVKLDSAQAIIAGGSYYTQRYARFVGTGTAYIIGTAPGVAPDTSYQITVTPATLSFSFNKLFQANRTSRSNPFYVSIPNGRSVAVTVQLTHSAPAVAKLASDSVVIGVGGYYQYEASESMLALGTDTIIATATGYVPDTAVIVSTTRHIDGTTLPGTGTTTDAPYALYAYVRDDSSNTVDYTIDTLTLKLISSDTTVLRLDSTFVHMPPGAYYTNYAYARPVGPGTAYIVFKDSAGVMPPDSTNVISITGPKLSFSTTSLAIGMKQQFNNDMYVSIPNAIATDLVINLQSSDTTVLKVPATVTITAGSTYSYFPAYAQDTIGTVQIAGSATGYSPPTPINVQVGRPQFRVITSTSGYTTSGPQSITVYAQDQNGTTRYVSEPVTVKLLSSATGVLTVDSAFVTIPAGQYYNNTATWSPVAPGAASISATDPRTVYRAYLGGAQAVTVATPPLSISFGTMNLVPGTYDQFYVSAPTYEPDTLTVSITHSGAFTTSPTQLIIPKGSYYSAYANVQANANGVDTIVVTAAGHLPDTAIVTVGSGQIQQGGWPTSLIVGDSAALTLYARDVAGGSHPMSAVTTFSLSAPAQFVFTDGTKTITSVDIQPGQSQSPTIYVKAVATGTGVGTISQANYSSYVNSITVSP